MRPKIRTKLSTREWSGTLLCDTYLKVDRKTIFALLFNVALLLPWAHMDLNGSDDDQTNLEIFGLAIVTVAAWAVLIKFLLGANLTTKAPND